MSGILPLLGVIVGGLTTYFAQSRIEDKKIIREQEKEDERKEIEKLKVYSQILKKDGDRLLYNYYGGPAPEFFIDVFEERFRPLIFEKIYLLDDEVIKIVQEMDSTIKKNSYEIDVSGGQVSHEDNYKLVNLYNQLIDIAESKIKEY